ncbi:hypothetical protein CEXT_576291 [Caerostris extrusa]|uniref:Secreted protein n=1 Tax=Caerostris extrusa TaxID=172846 RepID=A0AAV4QH09_CAEEX|nr:hypothetical protein CEXT_576291 [Caerostris extrusa]
MATRRQKANSEMSANSMACASSFYILLALLDTSSSLWSAPCRQRHITCVSTNPKPRTYFLQVERLSRQT